jgi:DNA-binding GntR family transcriptional regulator
MSTESEMSALLPVADLDDTGGAFDTPVSIAEAIHRHLANEIVRGVIRPGDRLIETQLCERFGCSRSPLREALRMLSADGLVTIEPRRGARVVPLSAAAVSDLFQVRVLLEGLAARLAAERRTPAQLAELERLDAAMQQAVLQHEKRQYFDLNAKFHQRIATIAGNEYLAPLHRAAADRSFLPLFLFLSGPQHLERAATEHAGILDALRKGDGEAADALMRDHIAHAAGEAQRLIEERMSEE